MKTIYISIIALSSLLITSCNDTKKNNPQNEPSSTTIQEADNGTDQEVEVEVSESQIKAVDIALGKIEQKELKSTIKVNGEMALDPQKKAEITSLIGGVITQISVIEGQNLKAGQTVAYLENTQILEIQKNYLTTKKETQIAEQEYKRQKSLFEQGAGIEKTLQQAAANFEITKAQLTGLEKQLKQLSINPQSVDNGNLSTQIPIKTPISGTVGKINISTGSYIDTQTSLMNISDNTNIHCDLKVFEKDLNQIQKGQEVDITLTNQPSINLKGQIYEINQSFEGSAKDVIVHVNITSDKSALKLIPGMYVTGLIGMGKQKTNAIPSEAIVYSEGKKYIFVLDKIEENDGAKMYHFLREEVQTGVTEAGFTEIQPLKQLSPDATVVTANAFYLASMSADHGDHDH